jgi:hypothetical protein
MLSGFMGRRAVSLELFIRANYDLSTRVNLFRLKGLRQYIIHRPIWKNYARKLSRQK